MLLKINIESTHSRKGNHSPSLQVEFTQKTDANLGHIPQKFLQMIVKMV